MSEDGLTRYTYFCAQSQSRAKKSQKVDDKAKQWDKESMATFDCQGSLTLTIGKSNVAEIKLSHREDHIHYCPIDIPDDVVKYVTKHAMHQTPTQVNTTSDYIL